MSGRLTSSNWFKFKGQFCVGAKHRGMEAALFICLSKPQVRACGALVRRWTTVVPNSDVGKDQRDDYI